LKSLDYNVVMTFRFDTNNNITEISVETFHFTASVLYILPEDYTGVL